jgi:hypothetical protein
MVASPLSAGVGMLYNAMGIGRVDDAVLQAGTIVTNDISIE